MNTLLLFFALPVATIIFSIVLQKLLRNTFLTAATIFAVYLIVTFTALDINFLVYAIAYTIIAYITAVLTEFILIRIEDDENDENTCNCNRNVLHSDTNNIENASNNCMNNNYRFFRR